MGISGRDSNNTSKRVRHPVCRTGEGEKESSVDRNNKEDDIRHENKLAARSARIEERESEESYIGVHLQEAALERFMDQPYDEEEEEEMGEEIKVSKKILAKYMVQSNEESFALGAIFGRYIEQQNNQRGGC